MVDDSLECTFDHDTVKQAIEMLFGVIHLNLNEVGKLQSRKIISFLTLGKQIRLLREIDPMIAKVNFLIRNSKG